MQFVWLRDVDVYVFWAHMSAEQRQYTTAHKYWMMPGILRVVWSVWRVQFSLHFHNANLANLPPPCCHDHPLHWDIEFPTATTQKIIFSAVSNTQSNLISHKKIMAANKLIMKINFFIQAYMPFTRHGQMHVTHRVSTTEHKHLHDQRETRS